jgi:hypothetical protein
MDTATPATAKRRMGVCSPYPVPFLSPGPAGSRGYNPAAAFPGSSIGRASGC